MRATIRNIEVNEISKSDTNIKKNKVMILASTKIIERLCEYLNIKAKGE
jgi:hypothetical protein